MFRIRGKALKKKIDECFNRIKKEIYKEGTRELLAQRGILDVEGSRVGAIITEYAKEE